MRCPSTSDLVHAQANHAYDKLAVISDNIEALQAIYDFIFDIKEYLHQRLKEYMHKHRDELIDGQKTFTKPVRLEELELFSSVNADIKDTVGNIKLNFTTCSPYILFKVSRTDDETKEEYSSEVKLILDTCNGKPLLTIPPTDGEVNESSVRVDFLNDQLSSIKDRLLSLEDRATQLESDVATIQGRLDNALDYPVDGSNALVTSNGIYDYGQNIISALTGNVNAAIAGVTDANTTYSFSLSGNTLIITPSSGDAQTVDLSSLVSNGSGGGSNDSYIFAYPSGSPDGFDLALESINTWDIVTGDDIASAVEVSIAGGGNHPEIVTYTIDQNSSLDSTEFTYGAYWGNEAVYNPTTLSSSDSYRCIAAPVVAHGSGNGGAGDTRPVIRVKAGVFQRIGGGSGSTIQAIWYDDPIAPHTTFSSTVGNTYPGGSLYLPDGVLPNGTRIGGDGDYICVTASSYYVGDIDSSGPHYGGITIGTFRKIE